MSDLSPEELEFLESVRKEWGPAEDAAPPSPTAIRERLADKPWLAEPAAPTVARRFGRIAIVTIAAASVLSLGGVALRGAPSSRPNEAHASALVAEASLDPAPAMAAVATEAPSISIHSLPDAPPTPSVVAVPRKEAATREAMAPSRMPERIDDDTLAEELKLVRAAQASLGDGAPDRALESLTSHASRFPRGILRNERMTLQVLALCARGDVAAARDVKGELERVSPGSSHLQRLANSCAATR